MTGCLPDNIIHQITNLASAVDSNLRQIVKRRWEEKEVLSYATSALTEEEAKSEVNYINTTRCDS